jgi:hypothetical protein
MFIIRDLIISLLLLFKQSVSNNDFDRLPKPPVSYRYFANEVDPTYKILGSCSEVKSSTPISRCIIKIDHRYKPKYLSIIFANELVGTGIVIFKSSDNDKSDIIILTAFHIVVPQLDLKLIPFMLISFSTISTISIPLIIYYLSVIHHQLCNVLFGLIFYVLISSCVIYYIILIIYPFLFNSFFRITILSDNKINFKSEVSQLHCDLLSSKLVLSHTWWDDIGN